MKKDLIWMIPLSIAVAVTTVMLGIAAHCVHAQAGVSTISGGLDALVVNVNAAKFLSVPPCSKAAGCTGYVVLCNSTSTGAAIPGQCIKLNATATYRTGLVYEIEQDSAGGVSSATIPVGTVLIKPSAADANVTP